MTSTLVSPWHWWPQQPSRLEQPVGVLRLEGADVRRFLHGQTSAAIELAQAGAWIPTCCITATGRMLALAEVLLEEQAAWLVVRAGEAAAVRQSLDRVLFPADAVTLSPLEQARWITAVNPALPSDSATAATVASAPNANAPGRRWQALSDGLGWQLGDSWLLRDGAALPAALACRAMLSPQEQERWRLQQGLPAAPAELNDETNPFELGLADRVSLSKGCYVGQETLAKLATYDGVKQQLRRWHAPASRPGQPEPSPGAVLVHPDDPEGGRHGRVTSALQLDDGSWIGLAMVRRRSLEAPALQLGPEPEAPSLTLSVPLGFTPPPVGAGSQALR